MGVGGIYECGQKEAGVGGIYGCDQWIWLAGGQYVCNLWVWLVVVVARKYIDFLILLIPTSYSYLFFFGSSNPNFFSLFIIFCSFDN